VNNTRITTISQVVADQLDEVEFQLRLALQKLETIRKYSQCSAASVYEADAVDATEAAASEYGIRRESLYLKDRGRSYVYARQLAMWILGRHSLMTKTEIAQHFRPDMHVGTVQYAWECISDQIKTDRKFVERTERAETAFLAARKSRLAREGKKDLQVPAQ